MKLKNLLLAGLTSSALLAAGAQAASFSDVAFDPGEYLGIDAGQIENFESYTAGTWDESTVTNVGTFTALENSGTGSGSTCNTLAGGQCTELYLSDRDINGQGNITPTNGTNALQANDTFGMIWNASLEGLVSFNEILFGIRDAADQGATVTISLLSTNGNELAVPVTTTLTGLSNSEQRLVTLSLMQEVTSATLSIVSSRVNDSFTFDGGALTLDLNRISQVPLPAAAWLFLSVLGGAGILRRAKAKA